jgi:salicylate biosynthesis isochorismate synthase
MTGLDLLRRGLERDFGDEEIRIISVPAPRGRAENLLDVEPDGPAVFWSGEDRVRIAGIGGAALVRASGEARIRTVGRAAAGLWPRIRIEASAGAAPIPVRLFGGFSFSPASSPPEWAAFGEAAFVLPRIAYVQDDHGPRLVIAATAADAGGSGADALARTVTAVLAALLTGRRTPPSDPAPAEPAEDGSPGTSDAEWTRRVASIRELIAAGRAEKIVASRTRALRLPAPPAASAVLGRLGTGRFETRFAFRFGRSTFLGASPERLISRRGRAVRSDALAGTLGAGLISGTAGGRDRGGRGRAVEYAAAAELQASRKDMAEHRYVVRAIADALAPLTAHLDHPPEPAVLRLAHVLHLHTPIQGTLAEPLPVLDLVERLHPTPAVGGTPTTVAMDWIAGEEGAGRGWYAAPVGWFDAAGDGEFVVALRSALLHGDRALLYAGAGIVRDSDPTAELRETDAKFQTMLDALGA